LTHVPIAETAFRVLEAVPDSRSAVCPVVVAAELFRFVEAIQNFHPVDTGVLAAVAFILRQTLQDPASGNGRTIAVIAFITAGIVPAAHSTRNRVPKVVRVRGLEAAPTALHPVHPVHTIHPVPSVPSVHTVHTVHAVHSRAAAACVLHSVPSRTTAVETAVVALTEVELGHTRLASVAAVVRSAFYAPRFRLTPVARVLIPVARTVAFHQLTQVAITVSLAETLHWPQFLSARPGEEAITTASPVVEISFQRPEALPDSQAVGHRVVFAALFLKAFHVVVHHHDLSQHGPAAVAVVYAGPGESASSPAVVHSIQSLFV